MYSRNPAPPPRREPIPMGRPSYMRQRNVRPDFRVPPNYSGSAFGNHGTEEDVYHTLPGKDRPDDPPDAPPRLPALLPPPAPDAKCDGPRHEADTGGLIDLKHFPFGHGIGFEEILLLGLIFFLLKEGEGQPDRGDLDETVILLAILLFCG